MKTVQEIGNEIVKELFINKTGDEGVNRILKEWANSIIDTCAESATVYIETWDNIDEETGDIARYGVVDHDSIYKVKEKL